MIENLSDRSLPFYFLSRLYFPLILILTGIYILILDPISGRLCNFITMMWLSNIIYKLYEYIKVRIEYKNQD